MTLDNYVMAGYPAIILTTPEEDRAINECTAIADKLNLEFWYWSVTEGLSTQSSSNTYRNSNSMNKIADPTQILKEGVKDLQRGSSGRLVCLLDFHAFIKSTNVWRTAKDVFKIAKTKGITFIFISANFEVPTELEREVIVTQIPLPTREEISALLEKMAEQNSIILPKNKNNIVEAALGLTINETENAFAVTISRSSNFDAKLISQVKEQIICNGGLLEYKSSNESLETIGGLKNFTSWAIERFSAYTPEAQEYGLPYPKGVLLVGIPGCGKSLSAKALSNIWQKPLLKLELGKLFGSLVGDTEANTRRALATAEAMAPAILWIDEIEKGLSGIQSSGKTDSGVTSRMFGTILTWLQEKEAPVFVIATANNINQLPPEFLRKGRFDEIFFVDLPDDKEREDIFDIQFKKHKRNPKMYDLVNLANITEGYTGAEIEEAVVSSMFTAWNDGQREPNDQDVIDAIYSINPMAKGIMKDQIEALRKWSVDSGISLASDNKNQSSSIPNTGRVIRTAEV